MSTVEIKDLLISDESDKLIWDKIYSELKFTPSGKYRGHSFEVPLPFEIKKPFVVYAIDDMTVEQIDAMNAKVKGCFAKTVREGERLYALDWQHSSFVFDPNAEPSGDPPWLGDGDTTGFPEPPVCQFIHDERYLNGGYNAYYPTFFPDGDYHFFIEENLEYGLLGHPWRLEIWVFGERLISNIEKITGSLGWVKIKDSNGDKL